MAFEGKQKTYHFIQSNCGSVEDVFPLLCPVREADWLDGWKYKMIQSKSGLIEQDCVFTSPHHGKFDTVWQVTQYDKENYKIEFLRVTPTENVVKINIRLEKINEQETKTLIDYQYTGLNDQQNSYIEDDLENDFRNNMEWWEKSINHYLTTGKMLKSS